MSLLQYKIQDTYKLCKGKGVQDVHYKVYPGCRLGEVNLHYQKLSVIGKEKFIKCKDIGKATSYPCLVPHPVKDLMRMVPAVDMLLASSIFRRSFLPYF